MSPRNLFDLYEPSRRLDEAGCVQSTCGSKARVDAFACAPDRNLRHLHASRRVRCNNDCRWCVRLRDSLVQRQRLAAALEHVLVAQAKRGMPWCVVNNSNPLGLMEIEYTEYCSLREGNPGLHKRCYADRLFVRPARHAVRSHILLLAPSGSRNL